MDLLEESQDPPEICRADFENCWSRSSKVWGTNQLPITASLPAQGDCHVPTSNLRPPHLSFSFPVKTPAKLRLQWIHIQTAQRNQTTKWEHVFISYKSECGKKLYHKLVSGKILITSCHCHYIL